MYLIHEKNAPGRANDPAHLAGGNLKTAVYSGITGLAACGCILTWHQPVALFVCTVLLVLAHAGGRH